MYQVQQQDIERKVEFVSIPQRIILQKIQTKKITPDHKKFQVKKKQNFTRCLVANSTQCEKWWTLCTENGANNPK